MRHHVTFFPLYVIGLFFIGQVFAKSHRADTKYKAMCSLHADPTSNTPMSCTIALYSVWHTFNIKSAPTVLLNSTLCTPLAQPLNSQYPTVGVVSRGGCVFDLKTQHATEAGFAALIIVNTEEEPFLFGDGHSKQVDGIPTVMVGHSFWDEPSLQACQVRQECRELSMDISYVSKEKPRRRPIDVGAVTPLAAWLPPLGFLCLGGAVLAIASSATTSYFLNTRTAEVKRATVNPTHCSLSSTGAAHARRTKTLPWHKRCLFLFCLMLMLIFSFLYGSATLRKRVLSDSDAVMLTDISFVGPYGDKEISYNHKETDELIFETLTATISKNFWDYSLQSSGVIKTFQLSKENYDDDIFIHPPVFVYSLCFLLHNFGIPLALASVLFHTLTAALISPLVLGLYAPLLPATQSAASSPFLDTGEKGRHDAYTTALWATVIFIMCPIGRISSQKVWIDNAAVFTATFAAVTHILLMRNSRNLVHSTIQYRNLLSGFIYGLIALNCKITSLAVLPCLLCWTVLTGLCSHPRTAAGSFLSGQHLLRVLSNCAHFVGGLVAGHGPWVYLYHSITGRFLPNAWPSKIMIQNSLYLQAAMDRNPAAYLIDLFKFSPLQFVGFLFGLFAVVFAVYSLLQLLSRRGTDSLEKTHFLVCSERSLQRWALASFALWPAGFVGGLTLIGSLGGGFQVRFIVPILPATAVLSSVAVAAADSLLQPVAALLLAYSGMHSLFYAVLYSPLFADMHASIFDLIRTILETPYDAPTSDIKFMKHFGLKLD